MTQELSADPKAHEAQWLDSLQRRGLIPSEIAQRLQVLQRTTGLSLAALLQRESLCDRPEVAQALATWCGLPWISLDGMTAAPELITLLPARLAEQYRLFPIRREGDQLVVALGDVTHAGALDNVRITLQQPLRATVTSLRQWQQAFVRHYGVGAAAMDAFEPAAEAALRMDDAPPAETIDEPSVTQLVRELLVTACRNRATDLHLQPSREQLRIRERIDGVLYDVPAAPGLLQLHRAIISRLKIMAHLNIAERRLPQDGGFRFRVDEEDMDIRISTMPTPHGESVVLRLLGARQLYPLDQLGLFPDQLEALDRLLDKPHGIVFVTGPTGSGKTTTLYAYLRKLNTEHENIITIEDPIEQELPGVTQIQVHPKIDLTFARGLRSILRHDPDVIMVGEVRDPETAEIAIRSALTGHLVFSTLHTNDAASGAARLLDMGVEPYLLASSVECFVAQRLVRVVCDRCRKPAPAPAEAALKQLGVAEIPAGATFVEGAGCEACFHTGFRGRTGLFEILLVTDALRELIGRRASAHELRQAAIHQGMRTLQQVGWDKACQEITTATEVLRVS